MDRRPWHRLRVRDQRLLLYGLLYRTQIVPRWLSGWGFVGAVLILVAGMRGLYGHSPTSTLSILLTLPIGVQEMVLAGWLIVRDFAREPTAVDSHERPDIEPSSTAT